MRSPLAQSAESLTLLCLGWTTLGHAIGRHNSLEPVLLLGEDGLWSPILNVSIRAGRSCGDVSLAFRKKRRDVGGCGSTTAGLGFGLVMPPEYDSGRCLVGLGVALPDRRKGTCVSCRLRSQQFPRGELGLGRGL